MEKEKIREFIYYTQHQKKLPFIYFFLTKEFLIFAFVMYIFYLFLNPLIFSLISLLAFGYVIREYYHYKIVDKYELPVFKKISSFLNKKEEEYELQESKRSDLSDK